GLIISGGTGSSSGGGDGVDINGGSGAAGDGTGFAISGSVGITINTTNGDGITINTNTGNAITLQPVDGDGIQIQPFLDTNPSAKGINIVSPGIGIAVNATDAAALDLVSDGYAALNISNSAGYGAAISSNSG